MILLWLCTALATPVVLPGSAREVTFDDDADAAIEAGFKALSARRFSEAARAFEALADAGGGASAHYLEATARYEAGELFRAERAAREGLALDAEHGPLLNLRGLVQLDRGLGQEALGFLRRAETLAVSTHDLPLQARALLNQGVVHLDRGEAALAEERFKAARAVAKDANDPEIADAADANLALLGSGKGTEPSDPLGRVADRIRRGDVAGARALLQVVPEWDHRRRIHALMAEASVARAEGDHPAAAAALHQAVSVARERGLVREQSRALGELAVLYRIGGRPRLAQGVIQQAVGLIAGSSFRVQEVTFRVEAGRIALNLEDADEARAQLAAARTVGTVEDTVARAGMNELEGMIAGFEGKPDEAEQPLSAALKAHERQGHTADAARIATMGVKAWAGRDEDARERWAGKADKLFSALGDANGPAHVLMASGLGRWQAKDVEGALADFSAAVDAADAAGNRRIAAVARANAARVLQAAGHSADAVAHENLGAKEALERLERMKAARRDLAVGNAAYDARDYAAARTAFDRAFRSLESLGETEHALVARRSRAWASFNAAVALDPEQAWPVYQRLVNEADAVGDPELAARANGARAVAAARLSQHNAAEQLANAADEAERAGLDRVAGRCHAELAQLPGNLDERSRSARMAAALLADQEGAYALYAVAVDAHNAERYDLAEALATEALPAAGSLKEAVQDVVNAARTSRGDD